MIRAYRSIHTVLLERRCATCSTARADQLSLTQFGS
jgi:hypothetical protein